MPEIQSITTVRHLCCELTHDELLDRGQKLAYHLSEIARIDSELASFKSQIKSRLDMANAKVQDYQQQVAEKAEWRDVECRDDYDYEAKLVRSFRLDTDEQIGSRQMTGDELQGVLPLD